MTELSLDQAFQLALTHHLSGRLQEAESLYRAMLQVQPDHPDANRNLGLLLSQQLAERLQEANAIARTILQDAPDPPDAKQNLDSFTEPGTRPATAPLSLQTATAAPSLAKTPPPQRTAGKSSEGRRGKNRTQPRKINCPASPCRDTATPSERQALVALFEAGRFAEFETAACQLIQQYPRDSFGLKAYGTVLAQLQQSETALPVLEQALALNPRDPDIHNALGVALGNLGRLADAVTCYRQALRLQPNDAKPHNNLGTALNALGQLSEAEASFRQALRVQPNYAEAHNNLGILLKDTGRAVEAETSFRQALTLRPELAEAHNNLGTALIVLGRAGEAEASYRRALTLKPEYAEAHNNLGNVLQKLGRLDEAESSCREAVRLKPAYAEAHGNLGAILTDLKRLTEAEASCRRALALQPDSVEAHNNLGNVLKELDRPTEAEAHYRQALTIKPAYAEAHNNLGALLMVLDRLAEAEASFQQSLTINPAYAEVHSNLGAVFMALGRLAEAEASFRQALALRPNLAQAHSDLGNLLIGLGRLDEAEASCRRALAPEPEYIGAHINLGKVLTDLGRVDEAEASYRRALAIRPDDHLAYSNLLFTLAYSHAHSPALLRREAQGWEQAILSETERLTARRQRLNPPSRQGRPLRIGLLSAELGQHAVAFFLLPWLRALDRDRFRLFLYPTQTRRDRLVATFQELADAWTPLVGLNDSEAADRIRADQIDILIDTSGHTAKNRLGVIARRAAPVQCHYIGYFGTTGLTEMDWFLADATLIPPELDSQFTERVWRLERPWLAYDPLEDAPEPAWRPDPDGTLWLGSFNNLTKVRDDCLELWAKVLHALPEARLLLKDGKTEESSIQPRIRASLAAAGIDEQRVVFAGRSPSWREHMAQYDRVDIALDPIPLTSGTTAFDALWMGVPLVTLAGDWMGGRMGAAILEGIERPEWIAADADEYVAKVVALAQDVESRRAIRATQRERMRQSPLCDGVGLARALEDAFEGMFDQWWATQ